jgi:hypothetical protein
VTFVLLAHKARSYGLCLVADCDVCVVVADRELDMVTDYELDGVMDCDIYVEGYEAKEVSVITY